MNIHTVKTPDGMTHRRTSQNRIYQAAVQCTYTREHDTGVLTFYAVVSYHRDVRLAMDAAQQLLHWIGKESRWGNGEIGWAPSKCVAVEVVPVEHQVRTPKQRAVEYVIKLGDAAGIATDVPDRFLTLNYNVRPAVWTWTTDVKLAIRKGSRRGMQRLLDNIRTGYEFDVTGAVVDETPRLDGAL